MSRKQPLSSLCACLSIFVFGLGATKVSAAAEGVEFNFRLPQVGQKSINDVQFDMDVQVTVQRNGEIASTTHQKLRRNQSREVTVVKTAADRATQILIRFASARETIGRDSDASFEKVQPIEGKSYFVERAGVGLIITDTEGNSVPDEEKVLVAMSTESVGRRNQLARFLHGRTVHAGETLELPKETAAELLGMSQARGDAQNVAITLRKTARVDGVHTAEFATVIGVKMASGTAMNIEGTMTLDVDTCRMISADFTGPVSDHSKFELAAPPRPEGVTPAGHQEPAVPQTIETTLQGTLKASVRSRAVPN